MPGPLRAPVFHLTGRYRLNACGECVVLQVEEATRPMDRPQRRWRNATPQDALSMIDVAMMSSVLRSSAA